MTDLASAPRWIVDREDSVETRAAVNALHDLAAGRIVVHRRPGSQGLPQDLLEAVGKDYRSPGWPLAEPRAWRLADLWLAAEAVEHIVIYGAHRLSDTDRCHLLETAHTLPTQLWLVTRAASRIRPWRTDRLEELLSLAFPQCALEPELPSRRPILCASDDLLRFRARCWLRLEPSTRPDVEATLQLTMRAVERWLAAHPDPDQWRAGALLEQLLSDAQSQQEAIVMLRAMQLAFFDAGHLLSTDTAAVCDSSRLLINARRGPAEVAALRRITEPQLAALGALSACTPLDSHRLAALRLDSVADHGGHVVSLSVRYEVPIELRGLVRAQQLARTSAGAELADALFADRAGQACTARRIRDLAVRTQARSLAGRAPRHVDDGEGRHLGGLLTIDRLRRAPNHASLGLSAG